MAVRKGGLGRGLDSLFADTGSEPPGGGSEPSALPLRDIEPDRDQPRKEFDPKSLAELAQSIADHGVLQPILVRPMPSAAERLGAGARRWRAARQAGLTQVPVVVREVTDAEALEIALIENLQREDLDPIEEAFGYRQFIDRCGYTQEQAAERLARSRSAVANALRLLALPQAVIAHLKEGRLTAGHAKAILSLPGDEAQMEAARRIIEGKLTVRQAEGLCKKLQRQPKTRSGPIRPALAAEVEISLREALGTEVRVTYTGGKGTLKVDFYSDEQLCAFANLLGQYRQD